MHSKIIFAKLLCAKYCSEYLIKMQQDTNSKKQIFSQGTKKIIK